jgi:uncharacterized iron-regulated protein
VLAKALAEVPFVLLGEIHDNPDHHRLQAWVVGQMVRQGRRPVVIWEMIPKRSSKALQDYLAHPDASAKELGEALSWKKSGWPAWENYQPIAEAAMDGGLPMAWGNINRELARSVGKEGFSVLGAARQRELYLHESFTPGLTQALQEEIVEGHCNMLPASATTPVANAQRLKDAVFADQMVRLGRERGAILIAGGGHVRRDRAVPWYLHRRLPYMRSKTLLIREVEKDQQDIKDYLPRFPDGRGATDFLWFTPRAERKDPCEAFRKHMAKKAKAKKEKLSKGK